MKTLFILSASLLLASASFAQDNTSLYKFDDAKSAKTVRKLGTAPEFPFLRNLSTPHQVYTAIKKQGNTPAGDEMNELLKEIGYTNGVADLQESDITATTVKPGTEGNMGSRGYTYGYYRLEGSSSEFRGWKIAANGSGRYGSLYIFSKCGNAFFPKDEAKTACINVPVTVKPDVAQVTLNNSGSEVTTNNKVYVYYTRKHHRRNLTDEQVAGVEGRYHSKPVRVDAMKTTDVRPETYTVTLNSDDKKVEACTGSTLELTANVNVEKTSTYTGNYPNSDNKTYKKVSKRHYKAIARKMRHAERKADKMARRTGVPVDVKLTKV